MVELISGQRSSWEEEAQRDSPEMVRILDSLSLRTGRAPEEIARRSGLSVAQTQSMLGLCALSGQARESAGAWRKNGTSLRNE
jgi:DNA processing protein